MDKDKRKTESCDETCEVLKFERRNWRIERNGWLKEIGWFRAENKRLKEGLREILKLQPTAGWNLLTCKRIATKALNLSGQGLEQALKNEQKKKEK